MSVKILVVSSVLLAAGCVSYVPDASSGNCSQWKRPPAEAAPSDAEEADETPRDPAQLAARSEGTSVLSAHVDEQYITGPGVSLGRYDEDGERSLRGTAESNVIDMHIEEGRVSGAIDSGPVDLAVVRDGTTLEVNGLLAGRVTRFRVDDDGLKGQIGVCSYDLAREGAGFTGRRSCSMTSQPFRLDMPDTMATWTDADIAAVFAIFLR